MKRQFIIGGILTVLFLGMIGLVTAQDVLKGTVQWDEEKARELALRHLERQIDVHVFQAKDEQYFERMRAKLQDPNLKFAKQQVTWYENGEYSVAYEGENRVHYYHQEGVLFKISVCNRPFGDDRSGYPRRCVEYSYPEGKFMTVSMDVSPEESYVFDTQGKLLEHWKDDQGFSEAEDTNWTRWSDRESNPPAAKSTPSKEDVNRP